jgi:hypothetical protein
VDERLRQPPLVIGSRSLPAEQQFDAWHSAACGRGYDLSREEAYGEFPAEMQLWRCGPFGFARFSVPPGRRWRGPGHIRAEPAEHWAVSLVARGRVRTRWGEAVVERRPGDLAVYPLMQPFEEQRSAAEVVYVFGPREAIPDRPPSGGPRRMLVSRWR